jgi:hypothetical protein
MLQDPNRREGLDYLEVARKVRDVASSEGLDVANCRLGDLATVIGRVHASYRAWRQLEAAYTARIDRERKGFLKDVGRAQDRLKNPVLRDRLEQSHPELVDCLLRHPVRTEPNSAGPPIKRSVRSPLERLVIDERLQRELRAQFGINPSARGGRSGKSPHTPYVKTLEIILESFGTPKKAEAIASAISHARTGRRRNGNGTGQSVPRKHKMPSVPSRYLN